jgi:hypothetical protein
MNMHADENSDGVIVPEKRPNKEGLPSAEAVEGRTPPKGNGGETAAARTLRRDNASNGLIAVRRAARQSKSVRFTALLHHITIDLLKRSYLSLERDSAPGIDGVTWQTYGENLEEKLEDLHDRVHRGSYRARPARRTYIPKADGSKRPLSILCLEDKIVQQAVATVLEAYRPVRSGSKAAALVICPFNPNSGGAARGECLSLCKNCFCAPRLSANSRGSPPRLVFSRPVIGAGTMLWRHADDTLHSNATCRWR